MYSYGVKQQSLTYYTLSPPPFPPSLSTPTLSLLSLLSLSLSHSLSLSLSLLCCKYCMCISVCFVIMLLLHFNFFLYTIVLIKVTRNKYMYTVWISLYQIGTPVESFKPTFISYFLYNVTKTIFFKNTFRYVVVITVPKKMVGDLTDPNNYRPIVLMNVLSNLLTNHQGSVVELVIKLIIWLAIITWFIPNHIIS